MNPSPYHPIDCNYYDLLEIAAMRRQVVEVVYQVTPEADPQRVMTRIEDLWARDGEEFVRLSDGTVFRLDRLISLDGQAPPPAASCPR